MNLIDTDYINANVACELILMTSPNFVTENAEVESLKKQLAEAQAENDEKDKTIKSLQSQLKRNDELVGRKSKLQDDGMKFFMARVRDEVASQTRELEAANKSLAEANQKVIRQSQNQLKHFAMMSHEIRTPLNCIVGLSNLLLDSNLDAELQESLEMITSSGDLLLAVVDDVLDYAKLATGKVETIIQPTNVRKTINAVICCVRPEVQMNGLELRTSLELPETMETDGRRLQQILYNLLGNAVKFGTNGSYVDFTVQTKSDADGTKVVQFSVKDYGKGIATAEMEKIFEPFQQAATNEPCHGGTGLGLAITRQLVRVLGGTISVQSIYGEWCEFSFHIPCTASKERSDVVSLDEYLLEDWDSGDVDESDSEDDSSFSSSSSSSSSSSASSSSSSISTTDKKIRKCPACFLSIPSTVPLDDPSSSASPSYNKQPSKRSLVTSTITTNTTIPAGAVPKAIGTVKALIAEDNIVNQKVLQRTLNRIGLEHIDVVDNGQKAVDASATKKYDIIFMDLQMPIMDGLEATRIISTRRQRLDQTYPKIVFLTAHALQDFQDKAAKVGGDGFISKPFKMNVIKELLKQIHVDDSLLPSTDAMSTDATLNSER